MKQSLTIAWLYPDLMSTYGDRGNVITLQKRCEWRGIETTIVSVTPEMKVTELKKTDLIFGGGAQDLEQEIVIQDLQGDKGKIIKELIEENIPALFVCGAPQLMGKYYEPGEGKRINGLGIFDMVSKHPGPHQPRLIGNVVAKVILPDLTTTIVGFENHGGRTTLGEKAKPFAKVVKGFGNNGIDKTEGVIYRNAIGCYFHGPLLPKNPLIADWLLTRALEKKYNQSITLSSLDDTLENQAHEAIARRLRIGV
jgi:CobQ-like glutamine amidotransferase family enzyme